MIWWRSPLLFLSPPRSDSSLFCPPLTQKCLLPAFKIPPPATFSHLMCFASWSFLHQPAREWIWRQKAIAHLRAGTARSWISANMSPGPFATLGVAIARPALANCSIGMVLLARRFCYVTNNALLFIRNGMEHETCGDHAKWPWIMQNDLSFPSPYNFQDVLLPKNSNQQ